MGIPKRKTNIEIYARLFFRALCGGYDLSPETGKRFAG
jgi:hypothetical protein